MNFLIDIELYFVKVRNKPTIYQPKLNHIYITYKVNISPKIRKLREFVSFIMQIVCQRSHWAEYKYAGLNIPSFTLNTKTAGKSCIN